jgi:hypothetical protein
MAFLDQQKSLSITRHLANIFRDRFFESGEQVSGFFIKEVIGMDKKMIERIHQMADRTWVAIAADALQALGEAGEHSTLSKDEVIELVGDADRMDMYGDDPEAYEAYKAVDGWDAKVEILSGAFPFDVYGY